MKLPNLSVVGLGCIGGSFAKAVTSNGGAFTRGWSTSAEDNALARAMDLDVPECTLAESMSNANLVIIAVPVQAIAEVAAVAMSVAPPEAGIIHCGGVQSRAALKLDEATYTRVIGAHPLAGSHDSGFGAARADLFRGCTVSIESRASEDVRSWMKWLWGHVGAARLEYRTADEHDAMMAWVSHLPQLASTALAATFAAEHVDPDSVGPGARDATRLAASAFEQWSSLVRAQPKVLDAALGKLQNNVASIREALARGDERALRKLWDSRARVAAIGGAKGVTTPIEIRVPGDKSLSHRALIFAALATGRSRIRDILLSADVQSTAGVLRALGVAVPPLGGDITVSARGARAMLAPSIDLDCGNSGTTTRLMAGVAAGCDFRTRFIGDASLSTRPMRRVARPLVAMGARVDLEAGDGLPMVIHGGALQSISWTSETASAQIKSAILLAGVVGGVEVEVTEPSRSRDHTERMLRALGARVHIDGTRVRVEAVDALAPLDVRVPADPSSAAFLIALAALSPFGPITVPNVCLNPTRIGFFGVLRSMGADVVIEDGPEQGGEPTGSIRGSRSDLSAASVDEAQVPSMIDELPLLACVGARANGIIEIRGAAELRVKESDRIATVVSNLRAIGATASELPDGLVVTGSSAPLRGRVVTHGDHRIAMAFGVLGALPGNEIEIDDPACVAVSYPEFWSDLARARDRR